MPLSTTRFADSYPKWLPNPAFLAAMSRVLRPGSNCASPCTFGFSSGFPRLSPMEALTASAIATLSLGVKFFRISFSAYSPSTMLGTSTIRAGIIVQPRWSRQAINRRSPNTSTLSLVIPMGCMRPMESMDSASALMSPRSFRWRGPMMISEIAIFMLGFLLEC